MKAKIGVKRMFLERSCLAGPMRPVRHRAGRRQPPGFEQRENRPADAPGDGEIIGAQDEWPPFIAG